MQTIRTGCLRRNFLTVFLMTVFLLCWRITVWGQNFPPDFSFSEGEGSDDAWGRDRIGDSTDPFGLAAISSGFGLLRRRDLSR